MDDRPEIPGYTFRERLGEGGVGAVWLADDAVSGRPVAVKILSEDAPDEERRRLAGWEEAARAVRHPALAKVIRAGEADGRLFVVMEHVTGMDLRRRVEVEGPLSEAEALDVGIAVAEGLAEARRSGIVHGDVKPGNVLVTERGGVKVCDLGLARPGPDRVGTPAFMAPEQVRGDAEIDERADVYALGLTLWFAVTGELPFPGDDVASVMDAQLNSPLTDPRERRAGLSERFATLLLRMAEKDPALRPGDWALLRAELGALRDPERPGANGLRAVRRGLARLDVRLSLAFLVLAAVAFGLTLAFRGGEAPDDGHRRAIAEAKARGALDEIDLRLEAYPGTELEAYESLRGLVERYPGTAAGHEALVRIRAIRGRLEALRKTRYTSTAQRARKLEAEGEYDRGIALLVELRPTLEATEWGPEIESEIRRIEGVAAAMLREVKAEIETLVDAGRLARALERLEDAPYQKAGGLAEYIDLERDRLRLELDR